MKILISNLILKTLGLLLLTSSLLKGYELLTEPVSNADIWSNRNFLIFTVEFELALGIWLMSGIFRRSAWLAAIACFSVFCCITLYKALAGYGSCGCFGKVHVNPWITMLAIDIPALIALFLVKPKNICNIIKTNSSIIYRSLFIEKDLSVIPNPPRSKTILIGSLTILSVITSSMALALNEPPTTTSTYEVLEPETWIGKELPILDHIDIADQIKTGNWLLLFYRHDCPDCHKAIVKFEKIAKDFKRKEDILQIALIELPQYKDKAIDIDSTCTLGKLDTSKEWLMTTPAKLLLWDNIVYQAYGPHDQSFEEIVRSSMVTRVKQL